MNNTTRRYPRTLHEAFPADASYACAIEHHRVVRGSGTLVVLALLAVLVVWSAL